MNRSDYTRLVEPQVHRAEKDDLPVERVGLEEIINAGHSASLPLTLLSPANMPRFCRSHQSRGRLVLLTSKTHESDSVVLRANASKFHETAAKPTRIFEAPRLE